MILGAIPSGTEIYLEDRTLKRIDDLCVGDKILSLEIKNEKNTSFEFYDKYINKNNKILKSDLKFSSAVVQNLSAKKNNYFKNNNNEYIFFNSVFPNRAITINFTDKECYLKWLEDSVAVVIDNNLGTLSFPSIEDEYVDKVLDKSYVYDVHDEIAKKDFTKKCKIGNGLLFSISLSDNFFIFTKNFMTIGLKPENLGYRIK